ncbi:MAG: peptidylprolyl isomerase [Granulosicoccus sp.]
MQPTIKQFFAALTLACALFSASSVSAQDVVLDRIRAVVNDGVVLDSDIKSALRFFRQQAASNQQTLPEDGVLSERILQELIDREIRQQRATQIGIAIDANSVNRAIEQVARGNNMNTVQFRRTLQQQGFDYTLFRKNIEQELLMQRLVEREVQPRIRVSAQEIDDYIESVKGDAKENQRYRIQHILIAISPTADREEIDAATERANAVLSALKAGADFSEQAATSSDGARALQGGDLGWRTLQELPAFLSKALRKMQPSQLSEPLRSANGLHIVKLLDRESNDQTQVSEQLVRHIFIAGDTGSERQKLAVARAQLQNGASFSELAAKISEDPNSANNGGELPWFSKGQMPPQLEQMANTLSVKQLSQPFQTQFGWHLMQLIDRRTRSVDDAALRDQANSSLRQSKVEQETLRWLRQMRDESFVEIRS